jgi:hypothetical protein
MLKRNEPTVAPPAEGWLPVATCQVKGDKIYNAGCVVGPEVVASRNFSTLVRIGHVAWKPPTTTIVTKPIDLPPPEKPKPSPKAVVVIVNDASGARDHVASWKQSYAATIKACAGNASQARDLLMFDAVGSDLWKHATVVAYQNERKRRGNVSIPADQLGLI